MKYSLLSIFLVLVVVALFFFGTGLLDADQLFGAEHLFGGEGPNKESSNTGNIEKNEEVILSEDEIRRLVIDHAHAWKSGDMQLLDSVLHEDVVFAYPGRRLNKEQTLEDLAYFRDHFTDVEVYINKIIIDGNEVAVEWQFAATNIDTGERQVVSDGIIAEIKDGKWIVWKEYLDGRVKTLQEDGTLRYEEGLEPFPWPLRR